MSRGVAATPGSYSSALPRSIWLIDGFECCVGSETLELPRGCQRLVAFLALWERPVLRSFVSGSLWPDTDGAHSTACLRSAVWRLNSLGPSFVHVTSTHLVLDPRVEVDYRKAVEWSRTLLAGTAPLPTVWTMHEISGLAREVLPDWYDEWVEQARERFRQLRLHALESLCLYLADRGLYAAAAQAGLSWRPEAPRPAAPYPWADPMLGAAALVVCQAWLSCADRRGGRVRLSLEQAAAMAFARFD